ncbi:signal peptidase 22 kDa subunit [Polychaeton citri CBS 116435]|uniref:Signal peptidase subunit 3 n=1 Tax=Polychaeton citri CBS 116435 TaxID=1314669 RepID=A0A9P4Q9Z2_9PEZI|nr:signal peptidase 22 kDa subunit [Polychaeton citri CBS 116435]
MHSSLVRIQNVFGFFTTVAFAVGAAIALSVLACPQSPSASLELRNVQVVKGRPHYYSTKREEYAHIKFDLDADLSSLFNWNTKQVFLYITATYPSTSPTVPDSEVVIWDAIVPAANAPKHPNVYSHPSTKAAASKQKQKRQSSKSKPYPEGAQPGILKLSSQKPKYQVTDATGKLAERANATLHLRWNVQPWVGALTWTNKVDFALWGKLDGGRSRVFDFPPLKGSEAAKKEDLKTEKGVEAHRLMVG